MLTFIHGKFYIIETEGKGSKGELETGNDEMQNEDYGLNVVNIVGSNGKLHGDIVQINKKGDKEEDIFIWNS